MDHSQHTQVIHHIRERLHALFATSNHRHIEPETGFQHRNGVSEIQSMLGQIGATLVLVPDECRTH